MKEVLGVAVVQCLHKLKSEALDVELRKMDLTRFQQAH